MRPKNFAVVGVAGFVAPRHLQAIRDTGHRLVAALDPHDSVGVLDRYSFDVRFFTEFERFDRHLEKLRRGPEESRVDCVSICSPNYLHDAHIRQALRVGADVICEKPLVINPWNLDALEELEAESGRRVNGVMQLRLHPSLVALKARLDAEAQIGRHHQVCLTYITTRSRWYDVTWKSSLERSDNIATNIEIHFFDLIL
jgi:UDP-N-acetyl-2-amino-2-deoxyglucuronate dehydrogenase